MVHPLLANRGILELLYFLSGGYHFLAFSSKHTHNVKLSQTLSQKCCRMFSGHVNYTKHTRPYFKDS